MRTTFPASALLCALSMNAHASDTRLTIYSGDFDAVASGIPGPGSPGYALVRETHAFELGGGAQALTVSGLPAAIDAAAVRFVPRGAARLVGQRFDFALADQAELLRRAIGRRVTVEQAIGAQRQSIAGTLLAAGDGLTLATDDGRVRVLADYSSFELEELPDGLAARPTLRFEVDAPRAGREEFVLDYPTGGLAWRAEYLATVQGAGKDCRMDFSGAAQVANRSGAGFADAAVTLVAGEPNRQHDPQPQVMLKMTRMEASDAPTPQASGEYHAYALPGRTALPDGSVQRVPLLADADAVACVRRYETAPSMPGFHPPQPIVHVDFGPTGPQPVMAMLQFANRKDAGLGIPLPAGRVRVFERNEGGDAFLGEAMLGHTASGREVRLALGEAFDLSLERTRDAFALDPDRHGATEAVTLVLRNAKSSAATVRVLESLPRWSDWRIDESTVPAQKHDAQTAAFEVEVPAGGEATVRYRVRYRWPDTPTPP